MITVFKYSGARQTGTLHVWTGRGRRHDMMLFGKIGLEDALNTRLLVQNERLYVSDDGGFVIRPWLQVGVLSGLADENEQLFNLRMSSPRNAVEWL